MRSPIAPLPASLVLGRHRASDLRSNTHVRLSRSQWQRSRRDLPLREVPVYIFAQIMSGLCGAGIVYRLRELDPCDRPRRGRTPHFYCSRDRQPVRDMCSMLYGSLFQRKYLSYDFSSYRTCPQYRHRGFEEVSFSVPDVVLLVVVCATGDPRNSK